MTTSPSWHDQLGLAPRPAPEFIRSVDELDALPAAPAGAHLIRRAWDSMGLDGALCVEGAPLAYFKVVRGHDPEQLAELHRSAWNQGVAPMVVVIADKEVRVYTTHAAPRATPEELDRDRLIKTFDRIADALELSALADAFCSGAFVADHRESFDPGERVDRYLVTNLAAAGRRLAGKDAASRARAHLLLAQVLFTCYLVDRAVIGAAWFEAHGIANVRNLRDLLDRPDPEALRGVRALLAGLHRDFNGDVFGVGTLGNLDGDGLDVLRELLRGDAVGSGQRSLGFWPYDFKVIPIETLSAVYEEFLEAEDPGGRAAVGAFYTPRTLAEFVLDVGLRATSLPGRVLDPACGSGVFLVAVFHRMVEVWRRRHGTLRGRARARALRSLLCDHIFGVDQSETACRITALGLYLAWLDHLEAPDIQDLLAGGAMLPPLVNIQGRGGENIIVGDFFDEAVLPDAKFDVVVGNPPWGTAAKESAAVSWTAQRSLMMPRRQLACAFAWKVGEHVKSSGRVALLVPATMLLNHQGPALAFVDAWLRSRTVERVVNLGDLRRFLFDDAEHACVCVVFQPGDPPSKSLVEISSPQVTRETQATDRIAWGPDDVNMVPLLALVPRETETGARLSIEWKMAMRASPRDRRLLTRLFDFAALEERLDDGPRGGAWVLKEGFNRGGDGKPVERPLLKELPFVTVPIAHIIVPNPNSRSDVSATRRYPDERVFRAPHILFAHGVPRTGERFRAGYSAADCVFTHSIRGLHAPRADEGDLRFLACVLSSPLALYVLFHTGSRIGIGRDNSHVEEFRQFPFPPPEDRDQRRVLAKAVELHRSLETVLREPLTHPANEADILREQIDEQVYRYYDLDEEERLLVRWTVDVLLPSATPNRSTWPVRSLESPREDERDAYCSRLGSTLSGWASGRWRFNATSVASATAGLGVVTVVRGAPTGRLKAGDDPSLDALLRRLRGMLHQQRRGDVIERGLKVFDGERLYLVKPLLRRHWGEAVALSDADEIAAAILTPDRKAAP